ncbi:hypothetical protein [Phenylobacterium sp.]|uniref:hypothetical protein n=1 Tax=Phenylobacterium sp. TaxID=1871053 RepID=UPI003567E8A1
MTVRAVTPIAEAPTAEDRPRPPASQHLAANVAFAPAAMSALIEAQEHLSRGVSQPARTLAVAKIDRLISILADAPANDVEGPQTPFAVRELQTAREALSLSPVDLQA